MIKYIEYDPGGRNIKDTFKAQDECHLVQYICTHHGCNSHSCPLYNTQIDWQAQRFYDRKSLHYNKRCNYYVTSIFRHYAMPNKEDEVRGFNEAWEDTVFILESEQKVRIIYKTDMPWYKRFYIYLKNKRFLDRYGARWI